MEIRDKYESVSLVRENDVQMKRLHLQRHEGMYWAGEPRHAVVTLNYRKISGLNHRGLFLTQSSLQTHWLSRWPSCVWWRGVGGMLNIPAYFGLVAL